MLHSIEREIEHDVGLLNLVEDLGNVWHACRETDLSRDFYNSAFSRATRRLNCSAASKPIRELRAARFGSNDTPSDRFFGQHVLLVATRPWDVQFERRQIEK